MSIPLSTARLPDVLNRPEGTKFKEPLRLQLTEVEGVRPRGERYQGVISDGVHSIPVLLTGHASTTLSQSVSNGQPLPGVILEAIEYMVSDVDDKRCAGLRPARRFVILACRVLGSGRIVGNPKTFDLNLQPRRGAPGRFFPTEMAPQSSQRMMQQQPDTHSGYQRPAQPGSGDNFVRVFQTQSGTARPPPRAAPARNEGGGYGNRVMRQPEFDEGWTPLSQLNNYSARWTIMARCTAKTQLRRFSNAKGEGKLFSFDLLDEEQSEMRCSAFNDAAVMFFEMVDVGRIYKISKADVMDIRNPKFKTFETNFEIRLNMSSSVEAVVEEAAISRIPMIRYRFKKVELIRDLDSGTQMDVLGILAQVNEARRITKKNGDEVDLRKLTVRDDTNCSIEITLWDDLATKEGRDLEEAMMDGSVHIVALTRLRVGDYNGKSLSSQHLTRIALDPDVAEAHNLSRWALECGGVNASINALSQAGMMRFTTRSNLSDININAMESDKPSFFSVCATINFIKTDRMYYAACPLQRNGRVCMKKLTEQGSEWMCEMCGENVMEPDWRYVLDMRLQDFTDSQFVTAFASAEEILGISAKDLRLMDDTGKSYVKRALHSTMLFTLKASVETWQGDSRLRISVSRQEPLNYVEETKMLLKDIEEYRELPFIQQEEPPPAQPYPSYYMPQTPLHQRFGAHGFPA